MSSAPSLASRLSPKLKPRNKPPQDALGTVPSSRGRPPAASTASETSAPNDESSTVFTGVLQKRRRKKRQGHARRFFSLDFNTSTLSYYQNKNSSALRGSIPLSLAAIGANAKTREISIDSGAEIWHLKAHNTRDFDGWKRALEKASRIMNEKTSDLNIFRLDSENSSIPNNTEREDEDWAKLEALLGRIAGTRDAVRRLCQEATTKPLQMTSSGPDSGPPTPTDGVTDDYFKTDERRPSFWKRKASANSSQTSIFKRSASSQMAPSIPGSEPAIRQTNLSTVLPLRSPVPNGQIQSHRQEDDMHDHCLALFRDLNSVTVDFTTVMDKRKRTRPPILGLAKSRNSIGSIESQEFFDADDGRAPAILTIQHDSEDESRSDEDEGGHDNDSITSSDIDDHDAYRRQLDPRRKTMSSLFPPLTHSLSPLPLDRVSRRTTISAPTIMPPSLIGFLRKNVGKDLSTISMPVSANEPTSLLQRAAEQFESSSLLDSAAKATDALERLIYTTAFAISILSSSRVRERSIRKPFNPMLGETYELVREDRGFRFVSEKVSHRPVQLAFLAESSHGWALTQSPMPSQKFWGKSSEIMTDGKLRLVLHDHAEHLSWSAASSFLRNILAGEKYVEPVGTMTILNETTGHKAVVTFKSKGMFSGRSEEVDVVTSDSHGNALPLGLTGTWTTELRLKEHNQPTGKVIWRAGPLVNQASKHYGMSLFAAQLNEITDVEKGKIPYTDSRMRTDQRLLEEGKHDQAEDMKNRLEEGQRARRRDMEANGEEWKPRWFTKVSQQDDQSGEILWRLKSGRDSYWEERARGEWTGVTNVLAVE